MIILFWIGFAVVVGIAANNRGRNGAGWGLLALVISPLLAGLLLLALPRLGPSDPFADITLWRWSKRRRKARVPANCSPSTRLKLQRREGRKDRTSKDGERSVKD